MVDCKKKCDFTTEPTAIPVEAPAGDLAGKILEALNAAKAAIERGDWLAWLAAAQAFLNLCQKVLMNDPVVKKQIQEAVQDACKAAYEGAGESCPEGCACFTGWIPFPHVQFTDIGVFDDGRFVSGTALVSCSVWGFCVPVPSPKPKPPDIELMTSVTVSGGTYTRLVTSKAIGGGNALSEVIARRQKEMEV